MVSFASNTNERLSYLLCDLYQAEEHAEGERSYFRFHVIVLFVILFFNSSF